MESQSLQEVRFTVVVPEHGLVIGPNFEKAKSFAGVREHGETTEDAINRIARATRESYGLPQLKIRIALGRHCDVLGYALQPTDLHSLDFHNPLPFIYHQEMLLRHLDTCPDDIDEVDRAFLRGSVDRQPRI